MLNELNLKKKLWKDIRSEQASTDMTSVIDDNLHGITYIEIQSVDPQIRENLANDAKAEKDKLAGEKEELESQLESIRVEKE